MAGITFAAQSFAAVPSTAWTVRQAASDSGGPDSLLLPAADAFTGTTTAAKPPAGNSEQAEEGPALPSPHLSDLLTVLPPADLSTLERGMQQFLDQLDRVGERLTSDPHGTGLYPWVIAVAAAAAACEMARRQLQKSEVRDQRSETKPFPDF